MSLTVHLSIKQLKGLLVAKYPVKIKDVFPTEQLCNTLICS